MENDTRIAILGVIVERYESASQLNELLHQYGPHIIGRMGLPYPKRGISIVSVAMDAPGDVISALAGKIGRIPGISLKVTYARSPAGPGKPEATAP